MLKDRFGFTHCLMTAENYFGRVDYNESQSLVIIRPSSSHLWAFCSRRLQHPLLQPSASTTSALELDHLLVGPRLGTSREHSTRRRDHCARELRPCTDRAAQQCWAAELIAEKNQQCGTTTMVAESSGRCRNQWIPSPTGYDVDDAVHRPNTGKNHTSSFRIVPLPLTRARTAS